MPGFIAEKASLFFMPFHQTLGMNKDNYYSCSSNICCYRIQFFDNFFEISLIFVSLFYLLYRHRQRNCADLAFPIGFVKTFFTFKFSTSFSGQFRSRWNKTEEYIFLTKRSKTTTKIYQTHSPYFLEEI